MTAEIFLIMKSYHDYCDEWDTLEVSSSTPIEAFSFRELADQICKEYNLKEARESFFEECEYSGLYEYIDNDSYNYNEPAERTFRNSHFINKKANFKKKSKDISDKLLLEVLEHYDIEFFTVQKLQLIA